jgi:hypothetical protein
MLYRFMKSLRIAIGVGVLVALRVALPSLVHSTTAPVNWFAIGRASGIYTAAVFVLVFTGILKPRAQARQNINVNPWFWGFVGVAATAVAVWALT